MAQHRVTKWQIVIQSQIKSTSGTRSQGTKLEPYFDTKWAHTRMLMHCMIQRCWTNCTLTDNCCGQILYLATIYSCPTGQIVNMLWFGVELSLKWKLSINQVDVRRYKADCWTHTHTYTCTVANISLKFRQFTCNNV
jgi:hypothetical protein